jgi:hypothetical protein
MQDFHYQILPLHHVHDSQKEMVNTVYEMWEMTFGKVLTSAGGTLDHADFFRCHSAGVILYKNEIIGFNLFTVFDLHLKAHGRHPYFEYLNPETISSLKERKLTRLITMEYFTVSPTWRRKYREVPWSEILTGLGLQYMDHSPADAVIGTPRVDLGVDKMCFRLGAKAIQDNVAKMNYPCAVVLFEKEPLRHFLNSETHFWVKRLWKVHLKEKLQPGARAAASYNREGDIDLM